MAVHTTSSSSNAAVAPLPAIVCICHTLLLLASSSSFVVVAFSPTATTTVWTTTSGGRPSHAVDDVRNNNVRSGDDNVGRLDTANVFPATVARRRRRQRRRRRPPAVTTRETVVDLPIGREDEDDDDDEEEGGEDRATKISVIGHPAGSTTMTPPTTATTTSATTTGTMITSSSPDDVERLGVSHVSIAISKTDHDSTLALLGTINWDMAKNTSRRNVIRRDDINTPRNDRNRPYCTSFVMGRNMKDPGGGMSYWSVAYPEVYDELRKLMERYDPNFEYTHITLNRNLRCKRHTDGGNAGPSYIIGFGDYTGGELIVERPGGGDPTSILDLRGKFVSFDGKTQPHETSEFVGDRYTVVYYSSDVDSYDGGKFVDRSSWTRPKGGAKFKR